MRVDGKTLVITDPCYIAKDDDWGESTGFDWNNGNVIHVPGITNYLWEDSGYGDGSPSVITISRKLNPTDYIEELSEAYHEDDADKINKLMLDQKQIGRFCMDAGCMCVFCLDEIRKYNPEAFDDLRDWCYHVVNNFTGTVESYEDELGNNHFILTPDDPDKPYIITD